MMKCRKCNKGPNEIGGYLERVNAKGQPGIWQCAPNCDADMPPDERLLSAIETSNASFFDRFVGRIKSQVAAIEQANEEYKKENKAIGYKLRRVREEAGLSLREVARRMDISAPFLSDLERGNRLWNLQKIETFERAIFSANA